VIEMMSGGCLLVVWWLIISCYVSLSVMMKRLWGTTIVKCFITWFSFRSLLARWSHKMVSCEGAVQWLFSGVCQ